MELNHQIRLCRPFPFRFGFRAIFRTTSSDSNEQSVSRSQCLPIELANYQPATLSVPLHNVPPPERIDEESIESR